jgi:hypothetical protein
MSEKKQDKRRNGKLRNFTDESRTRCGAASARRAARDKALREKAALVFADMSDEALAAYRLRRDGRSILVGDLPLVEVARAVI